MFCDCVFSVIAQEATHKGIAAFSKDNLKHIDTQEKNPLPTAAGKYNNGSNNSSIIPLAKFNGGI